MKTIAAISTPVGSGGIGIVRMSGDKALDIAFSLFKAKNINKNNIIPRTMYLGDFVSKLVQEKCLLVYFKAPHSYTGEDLVEFQCHGGEFLVKKVLESCLQNGAELAENGEFTKRAFINGKMSLDNVEGVIDLINATSDAEIRAGYSLLNGKLFEQVKDMQQKLTSALAQLEVSLDYPEHDIEYATLLQTQKVVDEIETQIDKLLKNANDGEVVRNGINVAIVGKPNAGKSSILNAILGADRAIVTEVAGTTRDVLKESILYKGIKINFLDTAGLHESEDKVEKIGIEKAKSTINEADIVLFVIDASEDWTKQDEDILSLIKNKNHLVILNKVDINQDFKSKAKIDIKVSAVSGKGIDEIKQKIIDMAVSKNINNDGQILINLRQTNALKQAKQNCQKAKDAIKTHFTDITALEIKAIWNCLGKITGDTENETIIDEIFSRFCLGK